MIFLTPNMLNTSVLADTPEKDREYAYKTADMQNSGRMDAYVAAAIETARKEGVLVCDCYAEWKKLSETEDITLRLINRINHPTPEMHALFADRLYDLIIGDSQDKGCSESTMYQE